MPTLPKKHRPKVAAPKNFWGCTVFVHSEPADQAVSPIALALCPDQFGSAEEICPVAHPSDDRDSRFAESAVLFGPLTRSCLVAVSTPLDSNADASGVARTSLRSSLELAIASSAEELAPAHPWDSA